MLHKEVIAFRVIIWSCHIERLAVFSFVRELESKQVYEQNGDQNYLDVLNSLVMAMDVTMTRAIENQSLAP